MSVYPVAEIDLRNTREMQAADKLLAAEGLRRDKDPDLVCAMYDEEGSMIATGSLYRATLRCMAVASSHRGEGLLNSVLSFLTEKAVARGHTHLFVCTKYDTALFFKDTGFYEISSVRDSISFLENKRGAFAAYLDALEKASSKRKTGKDAADAGSDVVSAIVMNANPFTRGHLALVEQASRESALVHLFLVSEDESAFPFSVRKKLVTEGLKHLSNVILHESGPYMISNATFPSYFQKDDAAVVKSHASIDAAVFLKIADRLQITRRYVGEEPFSETTNIYNEVLADMLPRGGVQLSVVPRAEANGHAISASRVRALIMDDAYGYAGDSLHLSDTCRKMLARLVPPATLAFLSSEKAAPVLAAIREQERSEVTLEEVLLFREERVRIRQKMLETYHKPLVTFCMNIPGPVKTNAKIRAAFDEGVRALKDALSEKGIAVLFENERHMPAGDELVLTADTTDADALKALAVQIEEEHPAGRLFDLDVFDENDTKLSRKTPRKCIVCGEDVLSCSRSRAHSLEELARAVMKILNRV